MWTIGTNIDPVADDFEKLTTAENNFFCLSLSRDLSYTKSKQFVQVKKMSCFQMVPFTNRINGEKKHEKNPVVISISFKSANNTSTT